MNWSGGWRPYVSVAERREMAQRHIKERQKRGLRVHPVEIEGRMITRTFWGNAWCKHLESFSDYANRLPRGRTYVRNGSVCHLEIAAGKVHAIVSGSELYDVKITIIKLPENKWNAVKNRCSGQIGSLLELLQGKLSNSVMSVVTHRQEGLFPLPYEINLSCSCPDWAQMCKHVAATLYGVGARLDEKPELLFELRGVDHEELIEADATTLVASGKSGNSRRIAESDLQDVFGIEIVESKPAGSSGSTMPQSKSQPKSRTQPQSRAGTQPQSGAGSQPPSRAGSQPRSRAGSQARSGPKSQSRAHENVPKYRSGSDTKVLTGSSKHLSPVTNTNKAVQTFTGKTVQELRARFEMNPSEFATLIGVSTMSVGKWEKTRGKINLQSRTFNALNEAMRLTKKQAWKQLNQ